MKLKGISKLVLAGTALAATAATLTTATYAWYVSNATVSATGVTGRVNSDQSGSLYIALNNETAGANTPLQYKTQINLEKSEATTEEAIATDKAAGKFFVDALQPQSRYDGDTIYTYTKITDTEAKAPAQNAPTYYELKYKMATGTVNAVKKYYTRSGNSEPYTYTQVKNLTHGATFNEGKIGTSTTVYYEEDWKTKEIAADASTTGYYTRDEAAYIDEATGWIDAKGEKTTGKFITFKYWLKSSSAGKVAFKLTVDNTTASASTKSQQAFAGGVGVLPTGVTQGGAFIADAVHALRMEVVQTEYETLTAKKEEAFTATGNDETYVAGTTYYKKLTTPVYNKTADDFIQASAKKTYYKYNSTSDQYEAVTIGTEDGQVPEGTKVDHSNNNANNVYFEKVEYAVATAAEINEANGREADAELVEADSTANPAVAGSVVKGFWKKVAATDADIDTRYGIKAAGTANDYQIDKIALGLTGANYVTAGSTAVQTNNISFSEGGDANKYYYAVLGDSPANTTFGTGASTDANSGASKWANMSLTANTDTLFEFRIWLEGSDADCWDSCKGQDFTFDFDIDFTETV